MTKIKCLLGFGVIGAIGAITAIGYIGTVAYVNFTDNLRAESLISKIDTVDMTPFALDAYRLFAKKGCQYCHSKNSELPFFFALPIAKQLMENDIKSGLRHFQMEPMLTAMRNGTAINDVDLAKVENVLEDRSMPPALYLSMHWGSYINDADRDMMLEWISQTRQNQHKDSSASAEFKNEAIQPIYTVFPVEEKKVSLGNALFHDVRLSVDNSISCASCHDLDSGGADGLTTSIGVGGVKGLINAPTVLNSVFNALQFWDGRAHSLQEQAEGPPLNALEMASTSWNEIIEKLQKDPDISQQFAASYPDGITAGNITDAIAEFEKTLTTPDSFFDLYLKGNRNALAVEEAEGYQLFKTYQCDSCHSGEAMGGNSFEIMGLKHDYFADRGNVTDIDRGRFNATGEEQDMHRFKVPTLRNIALTAPYFHDASAKTLEDAVEKMAFYQTGVVLTPLEIRKITLFLGTINGQVVFDKKSIVKPKAG